MSGSVALPPRADTVKKAMNEKPVWSIQDSTPVEKTGALEAPLESMCSAQTQPGSICCKEIKAKEGRHLANPELVRNIILGLADGLTVPFGVTAGLAAVASSRIVVAGGIAEMVSGALSMGVGGYLSAKAERDHYRYMRDFTRSRIQRSCIGEVEREVTEVLQQVGLDEPLCRRVALHLLKVENDINSRETEKQQGYSRFVNRLLKRVARKPRLQRDIEKSAVPDELGVTAFLLKFAEGQEDIPNMQLLITAVTIGLAYAVGAIVSLLPYFFTRDVLHALYISIGVTGGTLLVFGVVKAYFTGSQIGWYGYTRSALETLLVGGLAAGSAYGIGRAIEGSSLLR